MSNERKPHKHAEVIKAWADGATVEVKADWETMWKESTDSTPWWSNPDFQFRVKPEPVKVRYRVARMEGGTMTADDWQEERDIETGTLGDFVGWLTDWIEVEVPQ